jgi:hypothetical protein
VRDIHNLLTTAYSGLHERLTFRTQFGGALTRPDSCGIAVRGALALYAIDQPDEAKKLLAMIKSGDHFDRALAKAVRRHFNAPRWRPDWWEDNE